MSRGLASRTKIIEIMEKGRSRIPEIGEKTGLSPSCVNHHLKLFLKHKFVAMTHSGRASHWTLTKYGQEKLVS